MNWLGRLIGETQLRLLQLLRRSRRTITGLATDLHLTDNAVRSHIATLSRDGIVEQAGSERDTGGKPARIYGLSREGEELFPKAYALVLSRLVDELGRTRGPEATRELLSSVGKQLAGNAGSQASPAARAAAAVETLRGIGGDVELESAAEGWRIQGFGCPLSGVTAGHPEVCELARALVETIAGQPVTECCDRSDRPRCAFLIEGPRGA